jgi:hypothetical protein
MEHERMRFETMTIKQLMTRLGRITKRDKLERFIWMAETFAIESPSRWRAEEYRILAEHGRRKANQMRVGRVYRTNTDSPREHVEMRNYLNRLGAR